MLVFEVILVPCTFFSTAVNLTSGIITFELKRVAFLRNWILSMRSSCLSVRVHSWLITAPFTGDDVRCVPPFLSPITEVAAVLASVVDSISASRRFLPTLGLIEVFEAWCVYLAKSILGYRSSRSSTSAGLNLLSFENLLAAGAACLPDLSSISIFFKFFSVSLAVPLGGGAKLVFLLFYF